MPVVDKLAELGPDARCFPSIQSSLLWVKLTILNMVRATAESGIEGARMIALSVRCRKDGNRRSSVPRTLNPGGQGVGQQYNHMLLWLWLG